MPTTDRQELERILELRTDQVDRVERAVRSDRDSLTAQKRRGDIRLRNRLLRLEQKLPWRRVAGNQEVVDTTTPEARRRVVRVREEMLSVVEEERARRERELIQPKRLRNPLRV